MASPVRIRDVPHGIIYRPGNPREGDLSEVPTGVLRECMFRSKNTGYRARTSEIRAPGELYEDVYRRCEDELRKRSENGG